MENFCREKKTIWGSRYPTLKTFSSKAYLHTKDRIIYNAPGNLYKWKVHDCFFIKLQTLTELLINIQLARVKLVYHIASKRMSQLVPQRVYYHIYVTCLGFVQVVPNQTQSSFLYNEGK